MDVITYPWSNLTFSKCVPGGLLKHRPVNGNGGQVIQTGLSNIRIWKAIYLQNTLYRHEIRDLHDTEDASVH